MKPRTKKVISGIVIIGLIVFFIIPLVEVNFEGQAFFLGRLVSPQPTGECVLFGCHCKSIDSLSFWLFGLGYFHLIDGCP